ncbi:MAG TPA: chemotaxis protein CheW [Polyangiaceae bacterium]
MTSGSAPRAATALLCQVGSLVCGLPLEHISETMRPLPVQPFDGMPAFVAGLSIIRGAPVPVVDLARLLGNDSSARRTRFVVVKVRERRVALSVERVIGVKSLAALVSGALPPLLASAHADFVSAVGSLDAHLLLVLESGLILPASTWTSLENGVGEA